MKIFRRKLISETSFVCGVVLFMTIGIFSVVKFLGLLRRAVQGNLPTDGLGIILALKLATFLDVILTPALYIAILLVLIRWNKDNEITAYATSGIGPMGYLRPAVLVAVTAMAGVAFCSFILAPTAEMSYEKRLEGYRFSLKSIPFEEGRFRDLRGGQNVIYFSKRDEDDNDPIRLFYVASNAKGKEIIVAEDGGYGISKDKRSEELEIIGGNRYRFSENSPDYELTRFDSLKEVIPVAEFELSTVASKARSTLELISSDNPEDISELKWRISKVLTMPIAVLLAFAFGSCGISTRVSVNLIGAVLVYFIYSSLVGFIADIDRKMIFGIDIFLWMPHLAIVGLIVWVVVRTHFNRPLLPTGIFPTRES